MYLYQTPDVEVVIVAALLTTHATTHNSVSHGDNNAPPTKVEKVKRPSISLGGTSQDWTYFLCRWKEYVTSTRINGQAKVIQPLECCDEELRKDITRAAGSTLTQKDDILAAINSLAVREETSWLVLFHSMTCIKIEMNLFVHSAPESVVKPTCAMCIS